MNRLQHRREILAGILIQQQLFVVQLLAIEVLLLNIKMRKHCMSMKKDYIHKP